MNPCFRHSALPVYIVAFREIGAVVPAAALFAAQRGPRNQAPDSEDAGRRQSSASRARRCSLSRVQLRPGGLERQQRPVETRHGRGTARRRATSRPGSPAAVNAHSVPHSRHRCRTRGIPAPWHRCTCRTPAHLSYRRAWRAPRARRTRVLRAASYWPAGWRRARRCTPPRRPRRDRAGVVRPSRSDCTPPIT